MDFLEKRLRLTEKKTDAKTELMAGFTTFMTMGYILAVDPQMLSQTGMDKGGVLMVSVVASTTTMTCMAFLVNPPLGLAPGMGLNASFTFTVVKMSGHTWQFAFTAVFLGGITFLISSLFKVREMIFDAIPINLRKAVSRGVGLFIALVGLVNSGIILKGEGTVLQLGNLLSRESVAFAVGLFIITWLLAREIRGVLMYGILASAILVLILGVSKYQGGFPITSPPSLASVAFQIRLDKIFTFDMFAVVFTFLFVDIFDTAGTLAEVSAKAGTLGEQGKLKEASPALLTDAIGTTAGILLGIGTVTTSAGSASGIVEGGRSGFTSLSTAFFFFLGLFSSPVFGMTPVRATGSALVIARLFMLSFIKEIDFYDHSEAIPALITIIAIPFCYSTAEGISFGVISCALIKLLARKREDISILMYTLAIVLALGIIWPLS